MDGLFNFNFPVHARSKRLDHGTFRRNSCYRFQLHGVPRWPFEPSLSNRKHAANPTNMPAVGKRNESNHLFSFHESIDVLLSKRTGHLYLTISQEFESKIPCVVAQEGHRISGFPRRCNILFCSSGISHHVGFISSESLHLPGLTFLPTREFSLVPSFVCTWWSFTVVEGDDNAAILRIFDNGNNLRVTIIPMRSLYIDFLPWKWFTHVVPRT